jgi:hypothetical protein
MRQRFRRRGAEEIVRPWRLIERFWAALSFIQELRRLRSAVRITATVS